MFVGTRDQGIGKIGRFAGDLSETILNYVEKLLTFQTENSLRN